MIVMSVYRYLMARWHIANINGLLRQRRDVEATLHGIDYAIKQHSMELRDLGYLP